MESEHPHQGVRRFHARLVEEDPEEWQPAATIQTAAAALLCGADPRIVLDEEDDVRALAVASALKIASDQDKIKWANLATDIASKLGQVLSG